MATCVHRNRVYGYPDGAPAVTHYAVCFKKGGHGPTGLFCKAHGKRASMTLKDDGSCRHCFATNTWDGSGVCIWCGEAKEGA